MISFNVGDFFILDIFIFKIKKLKTKNCKNCDVTFEITRRNRKNVFCTSSCAISFNNRLRKKPSVEQKVKTSETLKRFYTEKFRTSQSLRIGKVTKTDKKPKNIFDCSLRTTCKIIKRLNLGCSICGWKEGTCDIHHINGRNIDDANNHKNLTLLCPNHHRLVHNKKIHKDELITLDKYLPIDWDIKYFG